MSIMESSLTAPAPLEQISLQEIEERLGVPDAIREFRRHRRDERSLRAVYEWWVRGWKDGEYVESFAAAGYAPSQPHAYAFFFYNSSVRALVRAIKNQAADELFDNLFHATVERLWTDINTSKKSVRQSAIHDAILLFKNHKDRLDAGRKLKMDKMMKDLEAGRDQPLTPERIAALQEELDKQRALLAQQH